MKTIEELTREASDELELEKERAIKSKIRECLCGISNAKKELAYWQKKLSEITLE